MIEFGTVQEVIAIRKLTVVSVHLRNGIDPPIKIGGKINFEKSGCVKLDGFKYWIEKNIVDLLFNDLKDIPEIGEGVSSNEGMA